MGNKIVPSVKGSIEIKTQRTQYYSNETIQGWVMLNVQEKGFKAGIVQLSVFFKNQTKFVGKNLAKHEFYHDSEGGILRQLNKIFLNSYVYLDNFGEQLPIIAIVYPFEIVLNLYASSFQIGFADEKTQIEFYLISEIVNLNDMMDTEIKFKLPIQIHQALSQIPKPISNKYKDDQCCCCLTKHLYPIIKVNLAKNEFQLQEIIHIDIEIDQSTCTKDLYLDISLYRKLEVQFPKQLENHFKIYQQELLKFEKRQISTASVQIKVNQETLCSTVFSNNIQIQYILSFHIYPSGTVYEFPITIIKSENLQINQYIYNYNQNNYSQQTILFDKKARLIVNQLDYMTQEQILLLTRYQNEQFYAHQQYENYHAYNPNFLPIIYNIEIPMITQKQQQQQHPIVKEGEQACAIG